MKYTCIVLFFLMTFGGVQAQLITIVVPMAASDVLSQTSYNRINTRNIAMTTSATTSAATVAAFTKVINDQLTELIVFSPSLAVSGGLIQNFIISSKFSSALGYNSYGYILKKYPILNVYPSNIIRNKIIRLRLFARLAAERDKVLEYLNPANPIPEGERILLMLESLENVINITLENETF